MVDSETEEKLRKLAPVDPQKAAQAWLFYLSGDSGERREADELIDVLLFQEIQKDYREQIFLDPADPLVCRGEYELGRVIYPPGKTYCSFGMREDEWIKHVLIVGMTGTGKTNLVFHILKEFKRHGKPFLVFDWKTSYRDLLQLPEFSDLLVFTAARDTAPFRFNPLIPPPGVQPGEWLMKLVDVIKHAYFVGAGVEYLLRQGIDWAYEQCGYHDKTKTDTPTFNLVNYYVAKQRLTGRMSLWKASAMRVLDSLCFRHGLGPVVNSDLTWDYETLLQRGVILELDALSDVDKAFLTEAIILWLYEYRRNEGGREKFKHALVIEEGHHILSHKKESAEGVETIMETSLRQIREFGEAVIVIDQEPTKMSDSIKANTYCKIIFNLGNGKDVEEISRSAALTEEEGGYIDLLRVGQAIVALKGRSQVPLHVLFPKVSVGKGGTGDSALPGFENIPKMIQ